jgi:hypothetical protein
MQTTTLLSGSRRHGRSGTAWLAAAVLLGVVAPAARGQLPIPSVTVMGGVSHFDLGAPGTAPFGAVRIDLPVASLIAEGSLGVFRPNDGGTSRVDVIPEAQLQWQILPLFVRPYVGAGIGWFRAVNGPSPLENTVTLSAAAGVRIGIPLTRFGIRGEARTRTIGSTNRRATEWTVGVNW